MGHNYLPLSAVPRFTGKSRITGKTAEIPERPKSNRETFIYIYLIVHFDIMDVTESGHYKIKI